jgi:hypothetical protein
MKLLTTWILLMLLTLATVVVYYAFYSAQFILLLFTAKFLLVVFQFMELHKAHTFWKVAIVALVVLINAIMLLNL